MKLIKKRITKFVVVSSLYSLACMIPMTSMAAMVDNLNAIDDGVIPDGYEYLINEDYHTNCAVANLGAADTTLSMKTCASKCSITAGCSAFSFKVDPSKVTTQTITTTGTCVLKNTEIYGINSTCPRLLPAPTKFDNTKTQVFLKSSVIDVLEEQNRNYLTTNEIASNATVATAATTSTSVEQSVATTNTTLIATASNPTATTTTSGTAQLSEVTTAAPSLNDKYYYEDVFPPTFNTTTGVVNPGTGTNKYARDISKPLGSFCSASSPYHRASTVATSPDYLMTKAKKRTLKFAKKTNAADNPNDHPQDLPLTECQNMCSSNNQCTYVLYSAKTQKCYMFPLVAVDGASLSNAGCSPFTLKKDPKGTITINKIKYKKMLTGNQLISPDDKLGNADGYKYYIKRSK